MTKPARGRTQKVELDDGRKVHLSPYADAKRHARYYR